MHLLPMLHPVTARDLTGLRIDHTIFPYRRIAIETAADALPIDDIAVRIAHFHARSVAIVRVCALLCSVSLRGMDRVPEFAVVRRVQFACAGELMTRRVCEPTHFGTASAARLSQGVQGDSSGENCHR